MVFLMEKVLYLQVFNGYNVCARVDGSMVYVKKLIKHIYMRIKHKHKDNGLMENKTDHSILHLHSKKKNFQAKDMMGILTLLSRTILRRFGNMVFKNQVKSGSLILLVIRQIIHGMHILKNVLGNKEKNAAIVVTKCTFKQMVVSDKYHGDKNNR